MLDQFWRSSIKDVEPVLLHNRFILSHIILAVGNMNCDWKVFVKTEFTHLVQQILQRKSKASPHPSALVSIIIGGSDEDTGC